MLNTRSRIFTMADSWTSSRPFNSRSSCASLRASSRVSVSAARMRTKARTTNTLIWTARGLLSTLAAMRAPCSVKAYGKYLIFAPRFKITSCDLERCTFSASSRVNWNKKRCLTWIPGTPH